MSNAWFERPQAGPSAAKALVGIGMVFCLPSVLISLLFYLYLPQIQGASRAPYASLYEMGLMAILIGFIIGLSMIYQYWTDVLAKTYQRSQLWATLWLLPIVVLGPLYYHLAVLLVAFKQRQRRAAYWSFLGVIGGCGQWLAIIWGLSGAFGINFQIGFWFSLCGIAAYLAATQALTQLVGSDGFSRRTIAAAWALTLTWFALQAWHCILTLDAEQRNAAEQLQLASAHGSDLVRSALNARRGQSDNTVPVSALGEILAGVSAAELYDAQPDGSTEANAGAGSTLSVAERERIDQWLEKHRAVVAQLDALGNGPALSLGIDYGELSLTDIYAQESNAAKQLWMAAWICRLQALRALQDGDGALLAQTLGRQAWLRDSAGAVPSMSFHYLAATLERQRLDVNAAALDRNLLAVDARAALKADIVAVAERLAVQRKNALFRDALDMLAAVEHLSSSPLARRQTTNATGIVSGLTHFGRYMPGFQALGGVLCNPIHWAMQRDLAWYFAKQRELLNALTEGGNEPIVLNVDDTPGYAYLSGFMLPQSSRMLQLAAQLADSRRSIIRRLD
ncbi:MAG: hypothetical protein PHT80_09530 [Lentisphaeria bacterium]|nr:hypothetical protein [Lentisphaeria bacterium]